MNKRRIAALAAQLVLLGTTGILEQCGGAPQESPDFVLEKQVENDVYVHYILVVGHKKEIGQKVEVDSATYKACSVGDRFSYFTYSCS